MPDGGGGAPTNVVGRLGAGPSAIAAYLPDLSQARTCIAWLVAIAAPTLIVLSLLIGPFQTLDEPSHFYRAVQLSEGRMLPVKSPQGDAAGDRLDVNLHKIAGYYHYLAVRRDKASFGIGPKDEAAAAATSLAHRDMFVTFSNTVIYFPLAHAVPAVAISVLRAVHAPPIAWMYGGRLANAAAALVIFCVAIALFPEGRIFVFVLALLPRTLFGTAALSADALLIPLSTLFAALITRLAVEGELTPWRHALLIASTAFICVTKIAYIPLVVIPPAIAVLSRRRISRAAVILSISGVATLVVWFLWTRAISTFVFPIRHDVYIDVYGQLHHVLANPMHGLKVLGRTLATYKLYYLDTVVGGMMGSDAARFPRPLVVATYLVLIAAAFIAGDRVRAKPWALAFTLAVMLGTSLIVFLLLYMQFTALDNATVDGFQGRYILPLLPAIVAFLPKFRPPRLSMRWVSVVMVGWLAIASVDTIYIMKQRFWDSTPAPGLRFGDPRVID